MADIDASRFEFLQPLVTGWLGKIAESKRARSQYDAVSKICKQFYSGAVDFMWQPEFRNRYLGGKLSPRFKICLAKAFELVALYGPNLYWQNPQRVVKPTARLDWEPDIFGAQMTPEGPQFTDPMGQFAYQQMLQEKQRESVANRVVTRLFDRLLNYTPGEQPYGGLEQASELAITEGLVSGRGVLWVGDYEVPGAQRRLTRCEWDSHENLWFDPDAESPESAWWVARERIEPTWEVERKFKLPPGSLKGKGTFESTNSYGERDGDPFAGTRRARGETNDLLRYYEIYSKMGAGTRLSGVNTMLDKAFDRVVGDYAYLCVAENVPYPLNAPSKVVGGSETTDADVERMFRWPIPYWIDNRWPFALLQFYRQTRSPYPIPPLAPGLGELMYLNIFMSHLAGRIYSSSRDFIAVLESAAKYLTPALEGGEDMCIIKLPSMFQDIEKALKFIDQPNVNTDAWQIIDRITDQFERRVGLNELLYGLNAGGVQSRTATDAQNKQQAVSVRPQYMRKKVEAWQCEAADMEKFAARWTMTGPDIERIPGCGQTEGRLWEQYVMAESPERVVRGFRAQVAANSAARRNREKDASNVSAVLGVLFPEFSKHADVTQDTGPLNSLVKRWTEAIEMEPEEASELQMGPRTPASPPPPPPEVQEQMQRQAELQEQQLAAETQQAQLDVQKTQLELFGQQQELQSGQITEELEGRKQLMDLLFDQQRGDQELGQDQERHDQEMRQRMHAHLLDLDLQAETNAQKVQQQREQGMIASELARQRGKQQVEQAKQMAAAKPKTNGTPKNGKPKAGAN